MLVGQQCFGYQPLTEASRRATLRFKTTPVEQLQFDLGQVSVTIGDESEQLFLLVATRGYSHRDFVCASFATHWLFPGGSLRGLYPQSRRRTAHLIPPRAAFERNAQRVQSAMYSR